ncbi:acyl-CoA dehydrogenase family protein [Phenylobacterium deserti]|uniref:Acyl-CoA dehydrogenase/oxidase N-terminal domain-containing protein n=1 Tax=Phenylobacterium deserti TaxID=1914756 RepID=A0A328ACK9_9CAUL|nr:acyl-CoA dehydrogenase family protein [Phenylobacterium deserti]RAK52391.1 hypothetical protein DJ018_14785 [Phenylobacterium deserti]
MIMTSEAPAERQAAAPPPASAVSDPVELSRTLGARLGVEPAGLDEKAFSDAVLAQLRTDRLLWAPAPAALGGLGASMLETARIAANVGRLSGSAGLTYAMHMSQVLTLLRHGTTPFLQDVTARLAGEQRLVASGTSEKGIGGDVLTSICTIEEEASGDLLVTKQSPNISYMDHAGAVLVTAMRVLPDGRKSQVLIAAETARMELRPGPDVGFIGMRGILNRPYGFDARFEEGAIFPEGYPIIARETMTPSVHILWAALWSGIAKRALDTTKRYLGKELKDGEEAALARIELSRLVDKHHTMLALIRDSIADWSAAEAERASGAAGGLGLERTARVKRLKIVCSELLQEICHGALGLIGLRAYAERGPYSLSEPLRDAMSARVMISNFRLTDANAKIERFLDVGL